MIQLAAAWGIKTINIVRDRLALLFVFVVVCLFVCSLLCFPSIVHFFFISLVVYLFVSPYRLNAEEITSYLYDLGATEVVTEEFSGSHKMKDIIKVCGLQLKTSFSPLNSLYFFSISFFSSLPETRSTSSWFQWCRWN